MANGTAVSKIELNPSVKVSVKVRWALTTLCINIASAVTFDPETFAAQWYARQLFPENVPALAADALEAGFDGPALRRLAGLVRPTSVDVQPWMETALKEIGCPTPLSREQALMHIAREVAKQIVDGSLASFRGCSILARYAMSLGYPASLTGFFLLYDEQDWGQYARDTETREKSIIEEARRFLNHVHK